MARPYVDSNRLQGGGSVSLCTRYLLPTMTLVGYLVVLFGERAMSLASLSFFGFGSQPPSSEWGIMVEESQVGVIQGVLGPAIVPGLRIAIVFAVLRAGAPTSTPSVADLRAAFVDAR